MAHLRLMMRPLAGTTRFSTPWVSTQNFSSITRSILAAQQISVSRYPIQKRFQGTTNYPTHFQPTDQSPTVTQQFQSSIPPPPPLPPQPPSRLVRIFKLLATFTIGSFVLGTAFLYGSYTTAFYGKPSPSTSVEALIVEKSLQQHPLVQQLIRDSRFVYSRPHMSFPPFMAQHSFTASMIGLPGKVPVAPMVFSTQDGSDGVIIMYLGSSMCGHPGYVHGGMIATILDEGLARTCFPALPNKVGMTANLNIDYRKPCKANQFVVLKATTTQIDGRKAWVTGRLETLPVDGSEGILIAEAKALFIEPKNAQVAGRLMKIVAPSGQTGVPDPTAVDAPGADTFPPK